MNNSTQLKATAIRRQVLELVASGVIDTRPYQYTVRKALGELREAGLVESNRGQDAKRSWGITVDGKLVLLRWAR